MSALKWTNYLTFQHTALQIATTKRKHKDKGENAPQNDFLSFFFSTYRSTRCAAPKLHMAQSAIACVTGQA